MLKPLAHNILAAVIGFCILLLQPWGLWGQVNKDNQHFQSIGVAEGLSHPTVYKVRQASSGELYIATANGLNRYNGYDLEVFYADLADSTAISNGNLSDFWEDEADNLWIGTWGGGLNLFNPHQKRFYHYLPDTAKAHSISDDRIQVVKPNVNEYGQWLQSIWLGTYQGGLNLFDCRTKKAKVYQNDPKDPNSLSHNRVWDICTDRQGNLWIGTGDGLNYFDIQKQKFERLYPFGKDVQNEIRTLHLTDDGLLWLGSNNGIIGMDTERRRFIDIPIQKEWDIANNPSVNSLFEYPNGTLWICTQRNGLVKYQYQNGSFLQYLHDPNNVHSIAGNDIRDIYIDASKVVWIATRRAGLSKFQLKGKKFEAYRADPTKSNALSDKQVLAITGGNNGSIWAGTLLGGVDHIDKDGQISRLPVESGDNSIIFHEVNALQQDQYSFLWIGTEKGLDSYNTVTKKFRHYLLDDGLQDLSIKDIHEDLTGRLWVATKTKGIHWFDESSDRWVAVPSPNEPYSNLAQCITDGPPRVLWVGTEGGLFRFNTKTMVYEAISALPPHSVRCLYKDQGNILWVGTAHGLAKYYTDTQETQFFTRADGLPSNQIDGILPGRKGELWVSSSRGIFRLDTELEIMRKYDMSDGLQGNVFSPNSSYRSPLGKLYFGGINGLTAFFPENISQNTHQPKIKITKFKTMGKERSFPMPIDELNQIELSYTDYIFSLEFAALDYAQPEKNQYKYRLEGYDQAWVEPNNQRSATYSHVDPGTYTFHVIGSNNDGIWNEKGASIKIIIRPPFWETTLFYSLCIGATVGIIGLIIVLRLRSLHSQRRQLREEVQQRTQELRSERDKLKKANEDIIFHSNQVENHRSEIEAQRDDIIQKNQHLEKALLAIKDQNKEINRQNELIEYKRQKLSTAQALIEDQNRKLKQANSMLETKVQQRTQELDSAYKDLLKAHQQLDHFTYRSAHDLKGPIARLLGLCYVGKLEIKDETSLSYLQKLEDNASEMSTMIDRLMRAHEIKTRSLETGYVSIAATVNSIWQQLCEANKVNIPFQCICHEEVNIQTDVRLVNILLENLLENAIYFRDLEHPERNNVKVAVQLIDGGSQVQIMVQDRGVGVPVEVAAHAFEMFVVGIPRSNGSGLGLYEVQLVAQRLNGRVWLQAYGGEYTTFSVVLPTSLSQA